MKLLLLLVLAGVVNVGWAMPPFLNRDFEDRLHMQKLAEAKEREKRSLPYQTTGYIVVQSCPIKEHCWEKLFGERKVYFKCRHCKEWMAISEP